MLNIKQRQLNLKTYYYYYKKAIDVLLGVVLKISSNKYHNKIDETQ